MDNLFIIIAFVIGYAIGDRQAARNATQSAKNAASGIIASVTPHKGIKHLQKKTPQSHEAETIAALNK